MRRSKVMACAMGASLLLAGCGGGADTGSGTGENALPGVDQYLNAPCPEAAVKPASDKEFTYWAMWTADEPQGKVLQKAFKCFQEKTGVKVNVQWLGRKAYTQNLVPALNTDAVPDLFDQDVSKVGAAIATPGGTQSVDDVFTMKVGEGDKTVKDVLSPSSYDFPQNKDRDGHNFMVPYTVQSSAWWFNKDSGDVRSRRRWTTSSRCSRRRRPTARPRSARTATSRSTTCTSSPSSPSATSVRAG